MAKKDQLQDDEGPELHVCDGCGREFPNKKGWLKNSGFQFCPQCKEARK